MWSALQCMCRQQLNSLRPAALREWRCTAQNPQSRLVSRQALRAVQQGGWLRGQTLYSWLCSSKSSHDTKDTTRAFLPSFSNFSAASTASASSVPAHIKWIDRVMVAIQQCYQSCGQKHIALAGSHLQPFNAQTSRAHFACMRRHRSVCSLDSHLQPILLSGEEPLRCRLMQAKCALKVCALYGRGAGAQQLTLLRMPQQTGISTSSYGDGIWLP